MVKGLPREGRGPARLTNVGVKPRFLCPGAPKLLNHREPCVKVPFSPLPKVGRGVRLDAVEAEIFWWWGQCCLFGMSTLTLSLPADMRGLLSPTRGCVGAKSAPQLIICTLSCLHRRIHDPWLWRWQRILFSLYSANYIF